MVRDGARNGFYRVEDVSSVRGMMLELFSEVCTVMCKELVRGTVSCAKIVFCRARNVSDSVFHFSSVTTVWILQLWLSELIVLPVNVLIAV